MNKAIKRVLIVSLTVATIMFSLMGVISGIKSSSNLALAEEVYTTAIALEDGASCRIKTVEEGSGIRFKAMLDEEKWTELAQNNEMTAGIIILPTDYIEDANGYTHAALDAADKNYLDYTFTEEEVASGNMMIVATITNILDQNYTRNFSGVAYLKSTSNFDDATEYDGNYYAYAEYVEDNNSRSIYQIAKEAYNDRIAELNSEEPDYQYEVVYNDITSYSLFSENGRTVLKSFLDAVVDLEKDENGEIIVANNTDYYTSPYTITKQSDTELIIDYDFSLTAKGMIYNGVKMEELSITESETNVSLMTEHIAFSENVSSNADGSVTMMARQTGGATAVATIATISADYIAFKGDYGIGTYVDFTFTGNNMPQVMFFADNINGDITQSGGSGVICMNGLTRHEGDGYFCRYEDYLVFGPNRINSNLTQTGYDHGQQIATVTNGDATNSVTGDYPLLSQWGLRGTPNTNYKYTVGTYEDADGYLCIDIYFSFADTDELIYHVQKTTNLLVSNMTVTTGNIVAYTCWKGSKDTETTTFAYSYPYTAQELTIPNSGATPNIDGSVTLKGIYPLHVGCGSGIGPSGTQSSYIAFEGDYAIGTYVDVEFTGNNMPYVMFFADAINGYIGASSTSKATDRGVVLINGMVDGNNDMDSTTSRNVHTDRLRIWGPYQYRGDGTGAASESTSLQGEITDCVALTQNGLNSDTYKDTKFCYTVGTYLEGTTVGIHIILTDLDTNTEIYNNKISTSLTESDCVAGDIILFASLKGENQTTTFFYSEPYTK